ncbi:hypothetical protein ACW9HM_16020 [Nocardia gipuzkoensis]|uniref:hypothetical protein n=2 Tax=Nocardiaceae TaxID=85025 RepID=UPI00237DC416|nr:hypothetical protein [Nocardia gipuzkoensis]MDE1668298.1 hypothetical protein [Nocardia gipuzkoensis]
MFADSGDPTARTTWRYRRYAIAVSAAAAVFTLGGCGSTPDIDLDPITTSVAAAPTTPAKISSCLPMQKIEEPDLAKFANSLELPPEANLFDVNFGISPDARGRDVVLVHLCVPASTNPDGLRTVATTVARALKQSELGARTGTLYIADTGAAKIKYRSYLVDRDFTTHPWDGTPSQEAELAIWEIYDAP